MEPIADVQQAMRLLRRYLAHAEGQLPAELFEELEARVDSPSPVDTIVGTAELLYANRTALDDEGRTIVAQLASFGAVFGWHGLADGNRGGLMAQAMQRAMAGDDPAEDEPEPKAHLVKAEPPSLPEG